MGQIQSLTEETYLGTAAGGECTCTAFKGHHCYLTLCVFVRRETFIRTEFYYKWQPYRSDVSVFLYCVV